VSVVRGTPEMILERVQASQGETESAFPTVTVVESTHAGVPSSRNCAKQSLSTACASGELLP
jgi:hypothetical protein